MRIQFNSLVLFLLCSSLVAQIYVEKTGTSTDEQLSSMYLIYGKPDILYDRTAQWAALTNFDVEKDVVTPDYFKQGLSELHSASNFKKFLNTYDIDFSLEFDSTYSTSVVGFLNSNYQSLKSGKNNFRMEGDQLHYISSGSPFETHNILMISPLNEVFNGPEVTFILTDKMVFDEHPTRQLESVVLHTENGKTHPILKKGSFVADAVRLNFSQTGYKTLSFQVEFTDGTQVHTQAKIYVKIPESCENTLNDERIQDFTWTSDISYQGYDETSPIFGELEYRIYFQTQDTAEPLLLKKPIIIIDGFDPLDGRKIEDCDPHNNISDEEHKSIREMMKYYVGNDENDIIDELRDLGYDVVVVNHPVYWREINGTNTKIDGGADYIERNGLNHASLYQEINRQLTANGSSEELVIVGPSMGGQISRYALAYMEKNNIDHNTRLWISVDSPHLGANIPMGIQMLLRQAASSNKSEQAKVFVRDWLGSTAAKQQLIEQTDYHLGLSTHYFDARTKLQGYEVDKGHPYFVRYYNNLYKNGVENSKGYPQQTRNIALVNGSITGRKSYKNPFVNKDYKESGSTFVDYFGNPGQRTLNLVGMVKVWFWKVVGNRLESYSPSNDPNEFSKISHFFYRTISSTTGLTSYVKSHNSRSIMDLVPGGWFPVQQIVAKSTIENINEKLDWYELREIEHVSSFIPTISALAHFSPEFNWDNPMNNSNLSCLNKIPFDSYYGETFNTEHTSFTEESIEWLYKELEGIETPPQYPFSYNIEGPERLCTDSSGTFKIADNICEVPSAVKEWSVSSGLTINSQDNLSISVSYNGNGDSHETITAELENETIEKRIEIGVINNITTEYWFPSEEYPGGNGLYGVCQTFDDSLMDFNFFEFFADYGTIQELEFESLSDNFDYFQLGDPNIVYFTPLYEGLMQFRVRAKNHCGWSDWVSSIDVYEIIDCSYNPWDGWYISPNPTKGLFTLHAHQPDAHYAQQPVMLTVYDLHGQVRLQKSVGPGQSIDSTQLKAGVYLVQIQHAKGQETHQLVVE